MFNVNGYGGYANAAKNYNHVKNNDNKTDDKKNENIGADFISQLQAKQAEKSRDKLEIGATGEKPAELSKTAQDYLAKLKEKNPDKDFIIADYETDEEADALLAKGKGQYNVLITPDLLEKMAADEAVAAEYEGIIASSVEEMKNAKEQLGEDADMLEKMGVSVDGDGNVTYHAKLIEGITDKEGNSTVKASTIGELLDRLNETKEANSEKLAEIRAKKAEAAEKAEEAKKAEEAAEKEKAETEATMSDVEIIAKGIVDSADEFAELTKFTDFSANA